MYVDIIPLGSSTGMSKPSASWLMRGFLPMFGRKRRANEKVTQASKQAQTYKTKTTTKTTANAIVLKDLFILQLHAEHAFMNMYTHICVNLLMNQSSLVLMFLVIIHALIYQYTLCRQKRMQARY